LADERATLRRYLPQQAAAPDHPLPLTTTIDEIVQQALDGNPGACRAITQTAKYLALGIQNIVVGLSPEFVVIAGTIIRASSLLIPEIQTQMRKGLHGLTFERTHIVASSLQEKPSPCLRGFCLLCP